MSSQVQQFFLYINDDPVLYPKILLWNLQINLKRKGLFFFFNKNVLNANGFCLFLMLLPWKQVNVVHGDMYDSSSSYQVLNLDVTDLNSLRNPWFLFEKKKIIKISLRKGAKSDYVLVTEPLFYDHLLIYIIIKIIEN